MRPALVLAPFALAAVLPAQLARDEWLACAFTDFISSQTPGGIWLVDAARTTATPLTNQTPNMVAANCVACDDAGMVYYGTLQTSSVPVPNPNNIMRIVVTGGAVVSETPLCAGPVDSGSMSGIVVVRDKVWYCTDAGQVGWVPATGGAPTSVATYSGPGLLTSVASDGRRIFVSSTYVASTPAPDVFVVDSESPTPSLVPLVTINNNLFALSLARDGKVLAGRFGGQMWLVDPLAATATQINVGATAPQSSCNGTYINPWLNIVGNVPGYGTTPHPVSFYDVATNTWPTNLTLNLAVPSGVACANEQPFLLFGHGCPGANAQEPRLGWSGLPMQGQSFTISLRNADQTVGLLFLGFSKTVGPFGPLPFSLAPFGAAGCNDYVSTDASQASLVSGTGDASQTLSVPVNPALAGMQLYGQWAVASSANSFGWVVSEAVHIRIR